MASSTRHASASPSPTIAAELKKLRETLARNLAVLEAPSADAPPALDIERHIRAEEEQKFASILTGTLAERDAKLIALEADATERSRLLDESTLRADDLERDCADLTRQLEESTARADDLERQCSVFRSELDVERCRLEELSNELELQRGAAVESQHQLAELKVLLGEEKQNQLETARQRAVEEESTMDVFREGDPIVLVGEGWYDVEAAPGIGSFRWVANEVRLNVGQLTRAPYTLAMDVEPGPATGSKPFELAAYEAGAKIAGAPADGRGRVELALPASAKPVVRELTLKTEKSAPAIPAPGDDRVMAYRVFSMQVVRQPGDVVHPAFAVGKGWYALESFSGETFRWAGAEAIIDAVDGNGGKLALEVEPGPGVGSGPFTMKVSIGSQPPISVKVDARQRIEIPYTPGAGSIKLHAEGGGKRVSSDPRILNFRAFSAPD